MSRRAVELAPGMKGLARDSRDGDETLLALAVSVLASFNALQAYLSNAHKGPT